MSGHRRKEEQGSSRPLLAALFHRRQQAPLGHSFCLRVPPFLQQAARDFGSSLTALWLLGAASAGYALVLAGSGGYVAALLEATAALYALSAAWMLHRLAVGGTTTQQLSLPGLDRDLPVV